MCVSVLLRALFTSKCLNVCPLVGEMNFLFCFVCVKVCFFWKIVKIMVTVLNISYYMICMVFDVAVVVVAAVLLFRTNQNYFI